MPGGDYEFREGYDLPFIAYEGTGNRNVPVPRIFRIMLNNISIDYQTAVEFVKRIGRPSVQIMWMPSENPEGRFPLKDPHYPNRVWGQGLHSGHTGPCIGVVIYRPSIWILLHELGHALVPEKYNKDEYHHPVFGSVVKKLYDIWMKEFHWRVTT